MKKDGVPAVFLCKRSFQCVFPNPAIKSRRQRGGARKKGARGKGYESATGQKFWMQKQEAEGRLLSVIYVLFWGSKIKNNRPEVCENHTLGPFCMHEISQAPLPQAIMCIHERPSFT